MIVRLQTSGYTRAANLLSIMLIGCGFAAILIYGWMRADEKVYQMIQQDQLAEGLTETDAEAPNLPVFVQETGPGRHVALRHIPRVLFNAWVAPDPQVIGKLIIPKLNVNAVIREGTDTQTLRRAIGHVPSSALPGKTGNFVVSGHRDTFFRPLRNIRKDDDVVVVTPSHRYSYRVYAISVVSPDQVHLLDPTREPECTLVTCFPFDYVGGAPRRFIVQGRLTASDARDSHAPAAKGNSVNARPAF
jgi:LPXTG-site transpeptidase (sortase) family protein